ncbi:hypothetical protein Leryth_012652 [Lithospermum erythrorhizon]|nr:hypothetical protein Leryth_012652 [Lithospermum erythrorhizon]
MRLGDRGNIRPHNQIIPVHGEKRFEPRLPVAMVGISEFDGDKVMVVMHHWVKRHGGRYVSGDRRGWEEMRMVGRHV